MAYRSIPAGEDVPRARVVRWSRSEICGVAAILTVDAAITGLVIEDDAGLHGLLTPDVNLRLDMEVTPTHGVSFRSEEAAKRALDMTQHILDWQAL